jgi:hypothetical protein
MALVQSTHILKFRNSSRRGFPTCAMRRVEFLFQHLERSAAMPSLTSPITMSVPFARSVAIAALMGATMLATPLTTARADTVTAAAVQLAQAANPAGAGATQTKGETVEQRITDLHKALKITPD